MQKRSRKPIHTKSPPVMSDLELARLGGGKVGYIKTLSLTQARLMFPMVQGLPRGIPLFSLHGADGTPIALTDTMHAAVGHAEEGELMVVRLH